MKRLTIEEQPEIISVFGLFLCLIFAVSKLYIQDISKIVEPILVFLGFWCIYRYGKGVSLFTPMVLLWLSIIIPLISWMFAYHAEPEWVSNSPQLEKFARLFIFIPLAWFLKRNTKHVFLFWGSSAAMIILMPWTTGGGWGELISALDGARLGQDWEVKNAQHVALFFGFVLIALLVFAGRLMNIWRAAWFVWGILVLLTCYILLGTQTRAAWIALCASFIVFLGFAFYRFLKGALRVSKKALIVLLVLTLLVLGFVQKTIMPVVEQRVLDSSDNQVLLQLLEGDFDNIPYTSWGIRANTWKAAVEHIAERPLTGWGGKGQAIAIDRSKWLPEWIKERFGHMHNIYIALLLQYGFLGFIFYFIWIGWIVFIVFRAYKQGQLSQDIVLFTVLSLAFWSVISLAESYLFFWTGVYCIQTLFAGLLAMVWHTQQPVDNVN